MYFNSIRLKLASPEDILRWSHGEVIKPETINYRTQRPEKDGLFSERIFGPTKDWECYCGKYRRIRYKGIVCDRCNVEVTRAVVRRERMGHISLAAPVVHIWYLKNVPSKLALVLDMPMQQLEKVVYYASYVVIKVNEENRKRVLEELEKEFKSRKKTVEEEGTTVEALKAGAMEVKDALQSLRVGQVLSETQFHNLSRRFGDVFEAGIGAEAVRKVLENLDLAKVRVEVEKDLKISKDPTKDQRLVRRLKLISGMMKSGVRPEWMIMTTLPVLPPDLRPMVALDGGRYATSDLNDLYRRVINRNNRLKKLLELKAPDVIVKNEKRMLQESVDALIDNSARLGTQQLASQRRPLQSLADQLKGKQGRFRQNLLGKRVDYSGRSVIVVGPQLRLDQCGLPKRMALELFKTFVISKVIERGLAHNIRNANRVIEQTTPEVWEILEEVIANRKVLLNRAPTLHRLGIQAFNPILTEDLAIQIPPMVCPAFNADFDGDQMAVHLPLSDEAQKEATELMLASNNLLKPATGDPIAMPTQDIVLGSYYLTKVNKDALGGGKMFADKSEAYLAWENELIAINAPIRVGKLETTVGQMLFNEALPEDFGYVAKTMNKKELSKMSAAIIEKYGFEKSAIYLDQIKNVGFRYATHSGVTWSMSDLAIPREKPEIMERAEKEVALIRSQYAEGLLTNQERRARIIEVWTKARQELEKIVKTGTLEEFNPIYTIVDSGSRGSWAPIVQMIGMKGLVANPKNETIELPIKTSLKEGHTVLEYFISTHGARKGTTDTALKTASAGYLTRRLVDVSQDIVVREEDCHTKEGAEITRADSMDIGQPFGDRIFSRTALEDIKSGSKILVKAGEIIYRKTADLINADTNVEAAKVRSPIACKTLYGICSKCYGLDLATNTPSKLGGAVGIIAAQSIGEPGTQLTMRTFHAGGIAGADITHGLPRVEELFEVRPPKGRAFVAEEAGVVDNIEERGSLKVVHINTNTKARGKNEKLLEYPIPRNTEIFVKAGDAVEKGQQLCEGNLDLKDLFLHKGSRAVERYIINEVQRIYASEGAAINNKHIEIMVRQMFSRVRVKDAGDSIFVMGDVVEKSRFLETNRQLKKEGKTPAKAVQLLLGITKVALSTESFFSAASFQETARVLVNASIEGKVDTLRGLKENVIIGRLIPAGTGYNRPVEIEEATAEEQASDLE